MRKGISFYFGYLTSPEERAKLISEAGFDSVITSDDPQYKYQNKSIKKQIKLFKKYNLKVSSLHARYKKTELNKLWENVKDGEKFVKNLIKDVKTAKRYKFSCVVVHLKGASSNIGYSRLDKVLKVCKKCNMPLAIENLDNQKLFVEVLEHYKNNPYVKVCYDSGHNHAFDPDFDYLSKYRDRIICLHLHDNFGDMDAHTLNRFGSINWSDIAKKLALVPNELSLDYELIFTKKAVGKATQKSFFKNYNQAFLLTKQQALHECFTQALELEKMILDEKSKLSN